ncbi:Protein tyrosine kinase/Protein kinase domain containing protein, putative [Angomonas deanei]|uniref:Protein tyrosine kinase/Protein kinase domain containing protein, putative n=1 Tax=Angomonas deanei TaxID=59799 RepID=A0A7G2C8S1_9TRYP|nr:Protein tyrosine kinase/Protein kinase domain containing protein, putative [Angomonas deanei]
MKSASPLRQKSHSVTSAQAKSVASTVFSPLQRSVSAELVLCVASLILERHSGLVQYPFTLSSLTQRHLPHTYKIQPRLMYATHRDPLGNRTRDTHHMLHASSGPSRLGPTAYHVMKSLQDFVHSPSNAVVRGLLKQWLFNEFGEKIRDALMAQTTAAQQAKETTSKTTRSISVSTEDLFRRPPDPLVELAMERSIPPYSLGYFVLIRLLTPRKGFMRHFEVSRRVGSGGYGSVMAVTYTNSSVVRVSSFVFTEHQLLRPYKNELTVKVIPLHLQGNECGSLPLVHAEILALLRMRHHPRVMTLLTFGCTGSDYFLVSPLYKGGNFSEWRLRHYPPGCAALMTKKEVEKSKTKREKHGDSGPSLLQTVGETFMQVLEAVSAAHQLGIRHGDLKAANIFIEETSGEEGRPVAVRLGDFGSCDSCGLEDAYTLYRDVEGGEARFVSGRWGSGSGTEAVQAPEVMVPKYRYKLFRDMIESENRKVSPTAAPNSGTATASNTASLRRSSMGREMLGSSHPSEVANEGTFQLVRDKIQQMELSVDVWSCGCLLYEMLTGRMLFGEARLGRLVSIAAWYRTPTDGSETATMPSALDEWERYDLQSAVGEPIVRFLSSLLSLDPLARPTAVEALYAWGEIMINHVGEKPNKKME